MSDWTDELKAEVVQAYLDKNPTPENTMEIVKEVADEYDRTPNSVRMILSKAEAYITKAPAKSAAKSSEGSKRVSKADALEELRSKINDMGQEVDDDIINRMTGKAAVYFTSILTAVNNG